MKQVATIAMMLGIGLVNQGAYAQLTVAPGVSARAGDQHVKSGIGVSLQAGGGATDFTGTSIRNATKVGGYWDVRAVFGTRSFLAAEAAYVGSARGTNAGNLFAGNATLIGNGVEGDLRLQVPFASSSGLLVEPFVFGGLGWSHYYLTSSNLNSLFPNTTRDNVGTVPVGGGMTIGYRGFIADARFTYRPTFGSASTFFGSDVVNSSGLQSWTAGLMLGFEF